MFDHLTLSLQRFMLQRGEITRKNHKFVYGRTIKLTVRIETHITCPICVGLFNTLCMSVPPPGDLPDPGIESRSPASQADSLLSEPPGKPKNGVGSLSLLQGIFPTQKLNWGFLHCRRILYQLSYQESPD